MVDRNRGIRRRQRRRNETSEPLGRMAGALWQSAVFRSILEIPGTAGVFGRGECLYRAGCDDGYSVVVETGWGALQFDVEDGRHCIIDFCLPGDVIGVVESIGALVPHTAVCLTGVSARTLPRDALLASAATSTDLRTFLCRCTVCREYRAYDHLANVATRDARGRVAHLLFELYCRAVHRRPRDAGEQMAMPLRLGQIGEAVGLTSVHVSRTLGVLRDSNVIDVQAGRMTILDPDKWRRLAGDLLVPLVDPLGDFPSARREP